MSVTAQAIPILSDNYAWLVRDDETGFTAIVDPAEEAPVVAALEAAGGRLDAILLTHHHDDHIAAVEPIRSRYGAQVIGAKADARRLPKLDLAVTEGDSVPLGKASAQVIDTPGHTVGHISYFIQPEVDRLRASGQATVPTHLAAELAENPFLHATDAEMLGAIRSRKDHFR